MLSNHDNSVASRPRVVRVDGLYLGLAAATILGEEDEAIEGVLGLGGAHGVVAAGCLGLLGGSRRICSDRRFRQLPRCSRLINSCLFIVIVD